MRYTIAETIDLAASASSKEEKIKVLRENYSFPLITVLQTALDPRFSWLLPKGKINYRPSRFQEARQALFMETKRFYIFLEGYTPPALTQERRELLFLQLLETIDPKDAELLLMIKEKKLPKGLNAKIINEAFPNLILEKSDEEVT